MPSRITVGLTRKVGLPRFSSVGAACEVTLEAPDPAADPRGFAARVRHAFAACDLAVNAELSRRTMTEAEGEIPEELANSTRTSGEVPCSAAQSRALAALCGRKGLDLDALARSRFAAADGGADLGPGRRAHRRAAGPRRARGIAHPRPANTCGFPLQERCEPCPRTNIDAAPPPGRRHHPCPLRHETSVGGREPSQASPCSRPILTGRQLIRRGGDGLGRNMVEEANGTACPRATGRGRGSRSWAHG